MLQCQQPVARRIYKLHDYENKADKGSPSWPERPEQDARGLRGATSHKKQLNQDGKRRAAGSLNANHDCKRYTRSRPRNARYARDNHGHSKSLGKGIRHSTSWSVPDLPFPMLAIEISSTGAGLTSLRLVVEAPQARPRTDEILIKNRSRPALARADVLQRQGKYPPPPGAVIFGKGCGRNERLPQAARLRHLGGEAGLGRGSGGYAEYVGAGRLKVIPIPAAGTLF